MLKKPHIIISALLVTVSLLSYSAIQLINEVTTTDERTAAAQSVPPGNGLFGTYYHNPHTCSVSNGNPSTTRVDGKIDFPHDSSATFRDNNGGKYYVNPCIIWEGYLYIDGATGSYTFSLTHDDGAVLFIDGKELYNNPRYQVGWDDSTPITLTQGEIYPLRLEYKDNGGGGSKIILKYRGPSLTERVVPQKVLYNWGVDPVPECMNSQNDDQEDQLIDYPDDPGCDSPMDDDEFNELCGNEEIDAGEECDRSNLAGKTCSSMTGGTKPDGSLSCSSDCKTIIVSGCAEPPPDPFCSDGIDNDGDGATDFPNDIGCDSATDNDENNPQCSDGIDNDLDGVIDFENGDKGCESERDDDETNPPIDRSVSLGSGGRVSDLEANKYPISILANEANNYYIKIQQESKIELVPMNATHTFAADPNEPLQNGKPYYFLMQGTSEDGKKRLAIKEGRYWDLGCVNDSASTSQALIDFFSGGNTLDQCVQAIQNFPAVTYLLTDPAMFQVYLDILTLCILNDGSSSCVPGAVAGGAGTNVATTAAAPDPAATAAAPPPPPAYPCTGGTPVTLTLTLTNTGASSDVTVPLNLQGYYEDCYGGGMFKNCYQQYQYKQTLPASTLVESIKATNPAGGLYGTIAFYNNNVLAGTISLNGAAQYAVNYYANEVRASYQITNAQLIYKSTAAAQPFTQQVTLTEEDGEKVLGTVSSLTGNATLSSPVTITISPETVAQKGLIYLGNPTTSDPNSQVILCKDAHNGVTDGIDGTCDYLQCQQ